MEKQLELSEFIYLNDYRKKLKEETESTTRSKEFGSLVPMILQKFPSIKIRDYLDTDGTFAVIVYETLNFTIYDALNLYQSVRDVVGDCTYCQVFKEGLIRDFQGFQGFWIQFG